MKNPTSLLLHLAALLAAATPALAHGGQYRGPGNVVPPSNTPTTGSNSSGTSGGSSNQSGTSSSPTTSGGATSTGSAGGSRGSTAGAGGVPRGVQLEDDLGRWEFWWEFGKDPFLRLRDAIYAGGANPDDDLLNPRRAGDKARAVRPSADDTRRVADALVANLRQSDNRDMVSGCIVALAKIGIDTPDWRLEDVLKPYLRGGDQELRETAALALGIAGKLDERPLAMLAALIADDAEGRHLSGDVPVNERTRAFAAYASGLLLARATQPAHAEHLCAPLLAILARHDQYGRELKVAAIEALAQFPRGLDVGAAKLLRARVVTALGGYYTSELGAGDRLLQAHVPVAIARLVTPQDAAAGYWKDVFADDLRSGSGNTSQPGRGSSHYIAQSCALALGSLSGAWVADNEGDGAIGALLLQTYRDHRDHQTRSFALLSIARLGGDRAREVLLQALEKGSKAIEQPWAAVGLGVWNARQLATARAEGRPVENDREVANALLRAFHGTRNPSSLAAFSIALGLAGDDDARDALRQALNEHSKKDDVAGYAALGLGLLRDTRATGDVRTLLQSAGRRPFVLMQCSRALGLIGDPAAASLLCEELVAPDSSLVRLAAASAALGQIGDRTSIEPLLRMLGNDQLTHLTRAFAAVALGSLCDKDPLPWNSAYATHTNYRAATETLTDGQRGILDIL